MDQSSSDSLIFTDTSSVATVCNVNLRELTAKIGPLKYSPLYSITREPCSAPTPDLKYMVPDLVDKSVLTEDNINTLVSVLNRMLHVHTIGTRSCSLQCLLAFMQARSYEMCPHNENPILSQMH